jgi:hypothetical protein
MYTKSGKKKKYCKPYEHITNCTLNVVRKSVSTNGRTVRISNIKYNNFMVRQRYDSSKIRSVDKSIRRINFVLF